MDSSEWEGAGVQIHGRLLPTRALTAGLNISTLQLYHLSCTHIYMLVAADRKGFSHLQGNHGKAEQLIEGGGLP